MECMLDILKQNSQKNIINKPIYAPSAISFCSGNADNLKKRVKMMLCSTNTPKKKVVSALTICIAIAIYVLLYMFIREPAYTPKEISDTTFTMTKDNCYLIELTSAKYEVYYQNKYFMAIDSLEHFPKNIIIYTEQKAPHHEN